ncbi:MAG: hypothetical protein A2070_02820 [Bdellovibrionales bacterium GWC1_52_8]|nr:MAG: hypothetical protein A2X97_16495 [Bdellovibrionales bacterium GWA1_52_35]OFZ43318.1 MAG: hypothetical protein A2070_02820 [Bdellovibrionales bacterium GWC1_52_8]
MKFQYQIINLILTTSALLLIAGCATTRVQPQAASPEVAVSEPTRDLLQEILAADLEVEPDPHSRVPIEINADVQKWITYFTVKDQARFRTFLERGAYYKELVQNILKEQGVPREMYYLAMIESGYVTHARSSQQAVGAWQFIRATGRRYGLKNNPYLDERRDIVRSTHAAARYLKDLHKEFGSWYLAIAGYNAGEGRIRRAIRKGQTHDFWILVSKKVLPRETMNYVPKFLAAIIIGRNSEKFGFTGLTAGKFPEVHKLDIPAATHLKEIAQRADINYEDLRSINPHLLRQVTPRNTSHYPIWVPKEKVKLVAQQRKYFTRHIEASKPAARRQSSVKSRASTHRVSRGDTLISIARRYRMSVARLKKLNGLNTNRIFRNQKLALLGRAEKKTL